MFLLSVQNESIGLTVVDMSYIHGLRSQLLSVAVQCHIVVQKRLTSVSYELRTGTSLKAETGLS